jgi:capsular polysaccharide biosynthesis protein
MSHVWFSGEGGTGKPRGDQMSDETLDLRRSVQLVRRHKLAVAIFIALGIAAGAAYTVRHPPMLASNALVLLSPSVHDTGTQVVIADSDPVLAGALRSAGPGATLDTLRGQIQVRSLTSNVISISAMGRTAAQAEGAANAVASSYIHYLSSGRTPGLHGQAKILEPAAAATGTSLATRLLVTGGLGALAGLVLGVIVALVLGRSDRRLRTRDELAESIGIPVLASIPVGHPSDASGWRRLLEDYEPGAVDAWRLRKTLHDLSLFGTDGNSSSLAVVSLAADRKALALGPQLAVFAASLGIRTALIIGPQQDTNATATLRAACTALPAPLDRSRNLQVTVSDRHDARRPSGTELTIVVAVVDGQAPQFAAMMHTTTMVLGVSAGAVTAEPLARVAASAAADSRYIAGILVADPHSADHTTGRLPWLARSARRTTPRRMTGTGTETRR